MKFNVLFAAALSIFGFVAAEEQGKCPLDKTELCTRELEGIVYQPHTAAKAYYDRISEELKCGSALLFSPDYQTFVSAFAQKYGVTVTLLDAFRYLIYVTNAPIGKSTNEVTVVIAPVPMYPSTSVANMNGNGYILDNDEMERTVYEFIVYNPFGEMRYVLLTRPIDETPAFKK